MPKLNIFKLTKRRRRRKLPEVKHFICQSCQNSVTYTHIEIFNNDMYTCKECSNCTNCGDAFNDLCINFIYCHCKQCVKKNGCKVFI